MTTQEHLKKIKVNNVKSWGYKGKRRKIFYINDSERYIEDNLWRNNDMDEKEKS